MGQMMINRGQGYSQILFISSLNYGNLFVVYFGISGAMTRHDSTSFDELLK